MSDAVLSRGMALCMTLEVTDGKGCAPAPFDPILNTRAKCAFQSVRVKLKAGCLSNNSGFRYVQFVKSSGLRACNMAMNSYRDLDEAL